jgi:hypothetical protein
MMQPLSMGAMGAMGAWGALVLAVGMGRVGSRRRRGDGRL